MLWTCAKFELCQATAVHSLSFSIVANDSNSTGQIILRTYASMQSTSFYAHRSIKRIFIFVRIILPAQTAGNTCANICRKQQTQTKQKRKKRVPNSNQFLITTTYGEYWKRFCFCFYVSFIIGVWFMSWIFCQTVCARKPFLGTKSDDYRVDDSNKTNTKRITNWTKQLSGESVPVTFRAHARKRLLSYGE